VSAEPGSTYRVRQNDTLWNIASAAYPGGRADVNRAMVAIYQANPAAFGGNINVLRAGSNLRMPSSGDVSAISASAAAEEVARQYRIIAAERHGRKLIVATADPLNVVALDDLRRATGLEVDFKIGPGWAIQEAIEKTYRRMVSTEGIDEALRQDLGLSVGAVPALEELVDIQQLRTQAADHPILLAAKETQYLKCAILEAAN